VLNSYPITEYCDQNHLRIEERLELFVLVCRAVQHAHQKGIIHRDLKPSNILVTLHDGVPVPKVIDFGIAKATGQSLTEKTLYTGFAQLIGTPLYMSPEQAELSGLDIDTRSDLYSLGVLLYELLTGTTPFDPESLRTAALDEVRRIIREAEPLRPSTRLSTLGATLTTVSANRRTDPRSLAKSACGELDWIVMKALEKDRRQRYETVGAFAADVMRYLSDQPVEACPPSALYRFAKFARRNRVVLTTTALVAMTLLLGVATSTWQAIRAVRAKQQAAVALTMAEDRLQLARQAVDEMYTEVAEKWLAQQADMTPLQRHFLEKALAFYQRLAAERDGDPAVRFEAAKAEQRVGDIRRKLGQHAEAGAAYHRALALLGELAREVPPRSEFRQELARAHRSLGELFRFTGRLSDAERELRLALELRQVLAEGSPDRVEHQKGLAESHSGLGALLNDTGRLREAEGAFRRSMAIYESLLTPSPDDRDLRHRLAIAQLNLARGIQKDRAGEAESMLRRVSESLEALVSEDAENSEYRANLAAGHNSLGILLAHRGRAAESETRYRRALKLYEGLAADFPQVPDYQRRLAFTLNNLGTVLEAADRLGESEQVQRRALEIKEKLVADHPDVPSYRSDLGGSLHNLSNLLKRRGELDEARTLLEQAIAHQRAALAINPDHPTYRRFLRNHFGALTDLATELGERQRYPEAEATFHQALKLGEELADADSAVTDLRGKVALIQNNLGSVLMSVGRYAEAEAFFRRAPELYEALVAEAPAAQAHRIGLRRCSFNLGLLLKEHAKEPSRLREAESMLRRALELSEVLVTDAPKVLPYRMELARTADTLGRLLRDSERFSEAEQAGRRAAEIMEQLAAHHPKDFAVRKDTGAYLHNLANTLKRQSELTGARQLLERAIPHQRAALRLKPEHPVAREFLGNHLEDLAGVLVALGDLVGSTRAKEELAGVKIEASQAEAAIATGKPTDPTRATTGRPPEPGGGRR
jgi:tetratricopeptide (TPR) repeat protein